VLERIEQVVLTETVEITARFDYKVIETKTVGSLLSVNIGFNQKISALITTSDVPPQWPVSPRCHHIG